MARNPGKLIPDDFRATPSLDAVPAVAVVSELDDRNLDAIGVLVTSDGDLPGGIGLDREALAFAGFEAKPGTTLALPSEARPLIIVVGTGPAAELGYASIVAQLQRTISNALAAVPPELRPDTCRARHA